METPPLWHATVCLMKMPEHSRNSHVSSLYSPFAQKSFFVIDFCYWLRDIHKIKVIGQIIQALMCWQTDTHKHSSDSITCGALMWEVTTLHGHEWYCWKHFFLIIFSIVVVHTTIRYASAWKLSGKLMILAFRILSLFFPKANFPCPIINLVLSVLLTLDMLSI